jgi:sugar lactone lactonase YvrE/DNA-binding IclR family transcriptional regulator
MELDTSQSPAHEPGQEPAPANAGLGVLEKAMGLLNIVSAARRPMTFTELLRASGLPRATLHRILATLVREGLLRHGDAGRGFQLGFRLLELAHEVWSDFDLRLAAQDELAWLRDAVGETVQLAVASGTQALVVAGEEPGSAAPTASALGTRGALTASAAGLAILCGLPPPRQEALLVALGRADDAALRHELGLARARGYALSPGREPDGRAAVAAPVFDVEGRAVGAVAVVAPAERLDAARAHALSAPLIKAARTVTHNAGGQAMSLAPGAAPEEPLPADWRSVGPARALLGEGPVWSPRDLTLYWVDILAPALHEARVGGEPAAALGGPKPGDSAAASPGAVGPTDTAPGEAAPAAPGAEHRLGTMISMVVPRASGGLLVATPAGLMGWSGPEAPMTPVAHPEAGRAGQRYNDGKCDRLGRLWVGSMDLGAAPHRGHLYRVDPDGRWARMDSGFTVPNGLGFSPDDRRMYFTDTDRRTVYEYDFDLTDGAISARRPLLVLDAREGKPDGLTVDAEGCLWVAVWDGWHVARYSPRGELLQRLRLPVPRPTSCCFGGARLQTLYVTSARVRLDAATLATAPLSGALFALELPGVRGLPETPFAG